VSATGTHAQLQRQAVSKPVTPSAARNRRCPCGGAAGLDGECAACRAARLARRALSPPSLREGVPAPPVVFDVIRSPGQALDDTTRRAIGSRFGIDLAAVRVHTDERAARSAEAVGALAYTMGAHIAFGRGQFRPYCPSGRALLAHELAHVAQQSAARGSPGSIRIGPIDDAFERDAARAASGAAAAGGRSPARLQRQPIPPTQLPPPLPAPSCLAASVCKPPICGSSWEFSHRVAEQETQRRGERTKAEQEGKVPAQPDFKPATSLTQFARSEAPETFMRVSSIWTSPEQRSAAVTDCGKTKCIVVTQKLEAEAAEYLAGARDIGADHRARADWRANARRILSHETGHARFETAPPPGIEAKDDVSLWELGELSAILSEVPVWYGHLLRAPATKATADLTRSTWDMWIESCGEGIRGILQKLRCLNPCDRVDRDVAAVALPRITSWPADVRAGFLAEVKNPAREEKAPPERKLRWPTP
jgi:hypothetical protein